MTHSRFCRPTKKLLLIECSWIAELPVGYSDKCKNQGFEPVLGTETDILTETESKSNFIVPNRTENLK